MGQTLLFTWRTFTLTQIHKLGNKNWNNGEVTLDGETAAGRESVISGQILI